MGCTSLVEYYSNSSTSNRSSNNIVTETPEEFEERMSSLIIPAEWTTHEGSLHDPIPLGEFGSFGIWNENRFSGERTDYYIQMKVNYAVRGDKALELYNTYSKELAEYEVTKNKYSHDNYEEYIPKNGNELMIINISMKIDSEEKTPLPLKPTNFNIATSAGVKIPGGYEYEWDYFEYYNLIDYEVFPGGEAVGYLVYEVPKGKVIYLEFVDVWFEVE